MLQLTILLAHAAVKLMMQLHVLFCQAPKVEVAQVMAVSTMAWRVENQEPRNPASTIMAKVIQMWYAETEITIKSLGLDKPGHDEEPYLSLKVAVAEQHVIGWNLFQREYLSRAWGEAYIQ